MSTLIAPAGLEGVVVADTGVGDVRGEEGFYHYRQYSAVDLAAQRSFEDVWRLMIDHSLPDAAQAAGFAAGGEPPIPAARAGGAAPRTQPIGSRRHAGRAAHRDLRPGLRGGLGAGL